MATHNRDKLAEIRDIFSGLPLELLSLADFPATTPVKETGTSLRENALLKAQAAHRETGLPALADDTGLEVDALGGAPGIYAARFAGIGATYRQNREKLLKALEAVPDPERTARFRTCALYLDDSREVAAEGVVEGAITRGALGDLGFGYDSIFRALGTVETFGQMSMTEKRQISHRGRALKALYKELVRLFLIPQSKEIAA
ncbi:MAG: RdgB/HAM1 family non-canonical purine NTP pyrophosphatase [Candidatus Neomarinimicrobiota bacterium]